MSLSLITVIQSSYLSSSFSLPVFLSLAVLSLRSFPFVSLPGTFTHPLEITAERKSCFYAFIILSTENSLKHVSIVLACQVEALIERAGPCKLWKANVTLPHVCSCPESQSNRSILGYFLFALTCKNEQETCVLHLQWTLVCTSVIKYRC